MTSETAVPGDTRTRIVEAAAQLLREQGPAAVTTRGVAEAAGTQAPTIYRLFGDKDGLLDAVAEHVMATYVSAKAAVVEAAVTDGVDPVQDLRSGWQSQVDFGLANPTLFRLLSDPERVLSSGAAAAGHELLVARVHRIAASGRLRVSEQRAVELIQAGGIGVISTLLATPVEQRDLELADHMFDAVMTQLLTDPPQQAYDGPQAIAVALRAQAPRLESLTETERALLLEWLDRVIAAG